MICLIISLLLAGCDRPADEDCWRGPVPIVRECDCVCGVEFGATPSPPPGDLPHGGVVQRGATDVADATRGEDRSPISIQITKLMIDPVAVPDREGEWIEVHNPTPLPAGLAGVEVAVGGSVRCMLPAASIPPFGFVVIARSAQGEELPCPKLSLPNRRGEVALVRNGEVIDVVVWKNAPRGTPLTPPQAHEELSL